MHSSRGELTQLTPLTIGPQNCALAIGHSWRWTRDFAKRVGLPVWRVGGKPLIPAAALISALEREAAPKEIDDGAEIESLRAQLGMRRASR